MTQAEYNVSKQTIRNRHIKIDLLNFNWQTIDSLEGYCIGGSITYNISSDLRRSCTIDMVINKATFDVEYGGEIFLNRYIKIWVGEEIFPSQEIVWFNKGIYLINSPTYKYSANEKTLSFQGLDLVSKLTGLRNGNLVDPAGEGSITRKIYRNTVVRDVIITILKDAGFTRYLVESCPVKTQQDYEFTSGSTAWDMLSALRDVYPMYQMYFDVEGVFHYEPIPTGDNVLPVATDDIWKQNVLSEDLTVDFENVKNVIEVFGSVHSPQFYGIATISGRTISVNYGDVVVDPSIDGVLVAFSISSSLTGTSPILISLSATGVVLPTFTLKDELGNNITELQAGHTYVLSYRRNTEDFIYLGNIQPYAYIEDTDPQSPFRVSGEAGKIPIALYGGEYDNIQTDYLARQRAIYELYHRCRLNDKITLNCVPIWYLDVNQVISYTPHTNIASHYGDNLYLIQSISMDLSSGGTMSITMNKYYPTYPE